VARVILAQLSPFNPATGATIAVRLAGLGSKAYTQLGFSDWRAGISGPLRFTSILGFDQGGWNGGALPQTGGLRFVSADLSLLTTLLQYSWAQAPVTIYMGDDEDAAPAYNAIFTGKVATVKSDGAAITFTISDLSTDLTKPVLPDTFAGTTGLEGDAAAAGRIKRRSWGKVFNVEGRILDKANSIYEFGDPNRPLNAFLAVKDKGRAGYMTTVAWAGSAIGTLNALRAATAPSGGGACAPSIACVKWWTTPEGPLTADLQGEIGAAYVNTAPEIAARLISIYQPAITIGNLAAALAWQSAECGVHCDSASETVANLLDRLLLPVSTGWILSGAGALNFRRFYWGASVETVPATQISLDQQFQQLRTRRVGYQRNYRQHTDAEIATSLVPDTGNLVPSPVDLSAVSLQSGAVLDVVTGANGRLADHFRVILPSSNSWVYWSNITDISVRPGEIIWYQHAVKSDASNSDTMDGGFETYGANGQFLGTYILPLTTVAASDVVGNFVSKKASFVVPANVAYVRPYAIRHAFTSGNFYVGEPLVSRYQPGADVTADSQATMTTTTSKIVPADSSGNIASGVLPTTVAAPKVVLGGSDITQNDATQYAIVATTGGCVGNVTVDTTNGSTTKGVQTIGTGFNATGTYTLKVTISGKDQPLIVVTVTKKNADPATGGGGGGGGGGTSGTMSTGGYLVSSGTFAQVGSTISNLTVASGKTATCTGGDDYSCQGTGLIANVTLEVKWQYSPTGAGTWTDVGSSGVGVNASYNQKTGDDNPGSVSLGRTVTPSAGSYDFRLMARVNAGSTGAAGNFLGTGSWGVSVA